MGLELMTVVTGEPALSFTYDPKRSLYEQFAKSSGSREGEGEGELEAAVRHADEQQQQAGDGGDGRSDRAQSVSDAEHSASETDEGAEEGSSTGTGTGTGAGTYATLASGCTAGCASSLRAAHVGSGHVLAGERWDRQTVWPQRSVVGARRRRSSWA